MRFKLVKTGKSYAEDKGDTAIAESKINAEAEQETIVPPVIWETGNVNQIRSLLVLREAELVLAKAQLTGNDLIDWYAKTRILDLEMKIADLRRWLAEAMGKDYGCGE